MGRILQTGHSPNFLHGHHGHRAGVAYYNAWVTPSDVPSNTDWLVMCGNNKGVVYVGNERRNIAVRHGVLHNADFNLYINEGFANEASDFGVMEVITWNRALSEDEMWTSMEYLNWKLQAHLAHQPSAESSMVAWFKSEDAGPAWKSAVGSWEANEAYTAAFFKVVIIPTSSMAIGVAKQDGKNIATGHGPQLNADFHLYINEGFANEASDFGVMEVITWNRALSEDEMWTSMEYLNWKIQVGRMQT
ncbi:unnamed protein product [Symbiodinium sp. KB8]|nr:unnamed protein product [Symbiodinium sp. KB8]